VWRREIETDRETDIGERERERSGGGIRETEEERENREVEHVLTEVSLDLFLSLSFSPASLTAMYPH
jgi:hypothetical protein